MRKLIVISVFFVASIAKAQQYDFYAIVTNYGGSGSQSQSVMSGFNAQDGVINNISQPIGSLSLPFGAATINQNNNLYCLVTSSAIKTFDLATGALINDVPINFFHNGYTNFFNLVHNTSDNTLYGLASTFTNSNFVGMYLSKLNTTTGNLTTVSQYNIGGSVELAGRGINPELMVYYYTNSAKFIGIDLYFGTVYSQPSVTFANSQDLRFQNFSYNCADNEMYGLITEDTGVVIIPELGMTYKNIRLGKINTTTGVVTRISNTILPSNSIYSSFSLTAGNTIDPDANIYYYSDGSNVYGVSTITGALVSTTNLNIGNNTLTYMENKNNCLNAVSSRLNPLLKTVENDLIKTAIYPNPATNELNIKTEDFIDKIQAFDMNGREVNVNLLTGNKLDISSLQSGIYLLKIMQNNKLTTLKFNKM